MNKASTPRILFDQQIFRKQNFGGISRYFTELITGINKHSNYEALPKKYYSSNIYLTNHYLTSFNWLSNAKNFITKTKIAKLILKIEDYTTSHKLTLGDFEIFHPTYYDPYFLKYLPKNKPLVITVHDMIHESYYDGMIEYLTEETKHKMQLIPRADHIIAVSQYTKNEILKYYPQVNEDKISVIYHGNSLQPQAYIKKPDNLPNSYLLFIGIKKHYKNFFWLADALHDYLKQNNITLLCAGGVDFDTYEKKFIEALTLQGLIKHVPINTDEDIVALFKHAICFVFPSLIEGFGIPILEAFVCECPMVLANSSCFPEIAADAALYFEPGDKNDLINKINTICNNSEVKKELIKKGTERVKQFSWENSVEQHLRVYDSLLTS